MTAFLLGTLIFIAFTVWFCSSKITKNITSSARIGRWAPIFTVGIALFLLGIGGMGQFHRTFDEGFRVAVISTLFGVVTIVITITMLLPDPKPTRKTLLRKEQYPRVLVL